MRQPRPEDYDPTYTTPSSRKLESIDVSGVIPIKPAKPTSDTGETPERNSERKTERTEKRSEFRTLDLPLKRRTKRYSFEFYDDQIVRLKQLKIQAEMRGESLNLSDMARAALDAYLKDRT
jgi:hypothetical protein